MAEKLKVGTPIKILPKKMREARICQQCKIWKDVRESQEVLTGFPVDEGKPADTVWFCDDCYEGIFE